MSKLQQAVAEAAPLLDIKGVAGVQEGRAEGQECVVVLVDVLTPELDEKIPREIQGILVDVRESGPFNTGD